MSGCAALIVVDERPLRSGLSTDFRRLYKNYCRHLSELRHHEERVRPAFHRWFHSSFRDVILEVEDLQLEVAKKTALLQRMRELCIFNGFSREGAFEQAHDEYEASEDSDDDRTESDATEDDSTTGSSDTDSWTPSRKAFEPSMTDSKSLRIKSLYRKLAQALHPDLSPRSQSRTEDAIRLEYWHETQAAYEAKDVEQLELLWTLVQITTNAQTREFRIVDLRAALSAMMNRLKSAKTAKRHLARTDPSWKFEKKDRASLSREILQEFRDEAEHLRRLLADLDEDLTIFEPSNRKKPASPAQMSFDL